MDPLPGTLFRHPSAVSGPFLLSSGSTAFAPWLMSLFRVECHVNRPVKISSSCRLMGTVKGLWSKGSDSIVNQVSSARPSVGKLKGRGEGVSSRMTNAPKPGDQLQRSSGRSTRTWGLPPWKASRARPSRSMRTYPKRYPSTSGRITSHRLHQSSPAQQVRCEQKLWICATGSFASDVRLIN